VQDHAFWELKNGESAMFWQDSWQQLKPLQDIGDLDTMRTAMEMRATLKVQDLWRPHEQHQHWRQWKTTHQELGLPENLDLANWHAQAKQRKILVREGADILRWGYSTAGTFTIKESYAIYSHHQGEGNQPI
jgi:hypothetical protein